MTRYVTFQQKADKAIIKLLEQASKDAEKRIKALAGDSSVSAIVERAQAVSARAEIQRILSVLWEEIGATTKANQARAASLAVDVGFEWDRVLFTRAGYTKSELEALKNGLESAASRNVEAAISRMTVSRVPLSARVYRSRDLSMGLVDVRINSALARGLNYTQMAEQVRDSIRPDTPGGVSYAAHRLARTEINAAYHAMSVEQNKGKPWNTGMAWHTSRSHPKPDLCDLYADRSPYPLGKVPKKPHPQCLCWVAPETVDAEEFVQQFRSGAYDDYIAANYGRNTRRVA